MKLIERKLPWIVLTTAAALVSLTLAHAQQGPRGKSSYMQVEITEPFSAILSRLSAQKPAVEREHMAVVNERYDLSNRPASGVTMDRTKPVQEGVRSQARLGNDVGRPRRYDAGADSRSESIPARLHAVAAP